MRFCMDGTNKPNQVGILKLELSTDRQAAGIGGPLPNGSFLRDNVACDTRKRARTRKSMSRRSGQNGYIEKRGNRYVVRGRLDVEGQKERRFLREEICQPSCPANGSGSARDRKAKQIADCSSPQW